MDVPTPNIIPGTILPDGTLELSYPIPLPPGPVRIHVEPIAPVDEKLTDARSASAVRTPGPIFLDESIPAPYDLPRPPSRRLGALRVVERLPELHDLDEIME